MGMVVGMVGMVGMEVLVVLVEGMDLEMGQAC
jgi:hypothetical protein